MERVLRQTVVAMRLGAAAGVDQAACTSAYYTSLLAWVGCAVDTTELAALFGDEIGLFLTNTTIGAPPDTTGSLGKCARWGPAEPRGHFSPGDVATSGSARRAAGRGRGWRWAARVPGLADRGERVIIGGQERAGVALAASVEVALPPPGRHSGSVQRSAGYDLGRGTITRG
jgi:hypothetical protein